MVALIPPKTITAPMRAHASHPLRSCLLIATVALCLIGGGSGPAMPLQPAGGKPKRIVSLNLCADQLILALADRDQIAGLTHNAANPDLSAAAAAARGLPILSTSAEQILVINPDLVIGMPARRNMAMAVLKAQNYRAIDLRTAENYEDVVASIRTVASAVGHPDRGEALIMRMNADLARIPKAKSRKVAAYYQRRGFLTGSGTLIDDLMTRVGLINLATKLQRPVLSQLSLEQMTAAAPDYLIVERATDRVVDQGTEMLHHPALETIPRISIPQAWTVCGGPAYVQAASAMSATIARR